MKKLFSSLLLLSLSLGACGSATSEGERLAAEYPVIYATVFTHAEQANGKETPNFVEDEDAFWSQRALVVEFATMLHDKNVGYDYQSDFNFLEAALKYDHGTEDTKGKNFLQYIHEDLGAEIDPHNHTGESGYNYADVAYLIQELGVTPSGVVGGFIASPASASTMEEAWKPIYGGVYDYTWTPTILWGGGTFGHQGDEESLWASGIWKPKDATDFLTNDDSAPLPVIGHWQTDWDGLDQLLEKQTNGELEAGKIYTISIDAHQKKMSEEFIQEFADSLDQYQSYVDEGQLQWRTLTDVYNIWVDQYDSVANQLPYDGTETGESLGAKSSAQTVPFQGSKNTGSGSCGDGVCQLLEKQNNLCPDDC